MSKSKYKPSGVGTLLAGIVGLSLGIIVIVFLYGYMAGFSQGSDIVIKQGGLQGIIMAMFGVILLGFISGVGVGLYLEPQRRKWLESLGQRQSRYGQPPPPPEES